MGTSLQQGQVELTFKLLYLPLQLASLKRSLCADLVESGLRAFEKATNFDQSFLSFLVLSNKFLVQAMTKRDYLDGVTPLWGRNAMGQRQRNGRNGRTRCLTRS